MNFSQKRLKGVHCLIIIVGIIFLMTPTMEAGSKLQIQATTAVLVDADTCQVLYEKNKNIKRPPASLTKILTAITALEYGKMDDIVKVSKRAAYQEGSSIYLKPGEEISLENLLYGLMLASGNDAAVAIAEHIGGSVEEFAKLMNQVASKAGAQNSNFLNPSGLPQSGHYSTALDLALIMRYGLQNKDFAQITATKTKTIPWADHEWGRGLRNHNKLLWNYPDATGGKTGYTRAAGRCLITSAARNDRDIIAVVLNSSNDWLEVKSLLNYGFEEFKTVRAVRQGEVVYTLPLEGGEVEEIDLIAASDIKAVIPKGDGIKVRKEIEVEHNVTLPIKKNDKLGCLYIYEGQIIGKTDLLAADDITFSSPWRRFWYNFKTRRENSLK